MFINIINRKLIIKNLRIVGLVCLLFFLILHVSFGQTISGIINSYYAVNSISAGCGTCNSTCSPEFTLSAIPAGLAVGDKVLVIQMQSGSGVTINSGSAYRFSSSYGQVTNTAGAGTYEYAVIGQITGSSVKFSSPLLNNYDVTGKVQLVKTPVFTNVSTSGNITGQAWNGLTGGVLSLEVSGTLSMGHNFDMDSKGFRGGIYFDARKACCNGSGDLGLLAGSYYFNDATIASLANSCIDEGNLGAYKGEGIVPAINTEELGRGALANGGGGGSGHNAGGGGGGNLSSGGKGGYEFQPCSNYATSDMGGRGGYALSSCNSNFIFMGGGGGAGHSEDNNTPQGSGGNGGGIIIIKAGTINATLSSLNISSLGANGGDSNSDAAGGAGAGGTILLAVNSYVGNSLNITANGGIGGYNSRGNCCATCHGPGGGGGGGRIYSSAALTGHSISSLGGNSGLSGGLISAGVPCGVYGATGGSNGTSCTGLILPQNSCSLPVIFNYFIVTKEGNTSVLNWNTLVENNTDYFEIQKSLDGINWYTIGKLGAKFYNYTFVDNTPNLGINYYRLKIIDFDNSFTFSEIRSVNFDSQIIYYHVLNADLSPLFTLYIQNFNMHESEIEILIFDVLGKEIEKVDLLIPPGESNHSLNFTNYSGSLYFLKILTSNSISIKNLNSLK